MIAQILNHFELAKGRLLEQFKQLPNIEAVLNALCIPIQGLEDVFFDMEDSRALVNAVGIQLDYWGALLNQPRAGITDDGLYRVVLLAKVAQNVSQGTPEDVMQVYKLLMQASYVQYYEDPQQVAEFSLTAVGAQAATNIAYIKSAVAQSKLGGVRLNLLQAVAAVPFAFQGFPDGNARGFSDLTNPTVVGGTLNSII